MIQTHDIRDSYNGGETWPVANVGRVFIALGNAFTKDDATREAKALASVSNWADGKKPATQARLRALFASRGMACETRYNAAHGRSYDLCVYPARDENGRRAALAGQSGMSDTNPEIARPIF